MPLRLIIPPPLGKARRAPASPAPATRAGGYQVAAAVVVLAGTLISITLFLHLRGHAQERAHYELLEAAQAVISEIEASIQQNLDAVRAVGGLYAVTDRIRPEMFRAFVEPLLGRNPSIRALEWAPHVTSARRPAFEATARADQPLFEITERNPAGGLKRAAERAEYLPLLYSEPPGSEPLGYDLYSSQVRREAAERARETGRLAATRRLAPVPGERREPALAVFEPVFQRDMPLGRTQQRGELRGYVLGVFCVADLIEYGIFAAGDRGLDIGVREVLPDAGEEEIYYRPAAAAGPARASTGARELRHRLDLAGREWLLVLTPATAPPTAGWQAWAALVGGLLYTLLLGAYIGGRGRRNARVERLADALSAEVEERRAAALEARRSRDFLAAILDTAGAMVCVLDREGRIAGVNQAVSTVSGYAFEEVVGRRLWEGFLPPDEVEEARVSFAALARGESISQRDNHLIAKDGTRHLIAWSARPLAGADGHVEHVVVSGIDLTDRARAEAAEKAAELAHLMRVCALGELGTGIAHEINQPLGAIANYAQGAVRRLQTNPSGTDRVLEALQEIVAQTMRAAQVVDRLRERLRDEAPPRCVFDLNAAARDLLRLLRGVAERSGARLELHLEEHLPPVHANAEQIEQVLMSLVHNAIEAMTAAGSPERCIGVRTRPYAEGEAVEVLVCDTGPGVPEEMYGGLFQPFRTTKPRGVGMGLAVCWSIVEAHGGRLWAERAPGGGTCFHFTLPIAEEGGEQLAAPGAAPSHQALSAS
jgi:PAS domain S-box-containing protein